MLVLTIAVIRITSGNDSGTGKEMAVFQNTLNNKQMHFQGQSYLENDN